MGFGRCYGGFEVGAVYRHWLAHDHREVAEDEQLAKIERASSPLEA
jgi:hypothetical protein